MQETWVQSLGWEEPLEKERQPTPVFLPGEFHGLKGLVGYSPWGHKRVRHVLATKQQIVNSNIYKPQKQVSLKSFIMLYPQHFILFSACGKGSININSLDYGEVLLLLKTKKVASCSLSGHGS